MPANFLGKRWGYPLIVIALLLGLWSLTVSPTIRPKAQIGQLDLRDWDFAKQGTLRLEGEWGFYWGEFLHQGIKAKNKGEPLLVPGSWNLVEGNKESYQAEGYATYHLKVLLPPGQKHFGVRIDDVSTDIRLYAGNRLLGHSGEPATNKEAAIPGLQPIVAVFEVPGDQVDLWLQISNFRSIKGGPHKAPLFGTPEQILDHSQE